SKRLRQAMESERINKRKEHHDYEGNRKALARNQTSHQSSARSCLRRLDRSGTTETMVRPGECPDSRVSRRRARGREVSLGPQQCGGREDDVPRRIPRAAARQKNRVHLAV